MPRLRTPGYAPSASAETSLAGRPWKATWPWASAATLGLGTCADGDGVTTMPHEGATWFAARAGHSYGATKNLPNDGG